MVRMIRRCRHAGSLRACQTVVRFHMRGVYFYNIPLNDDPAHPFSFPAYFVGNAGSDRHPGLRKAV